MNRTIFALFSSLLLFGPSSQRNAYAESPRPPLPEGVKTLQVNGYEMAYLERGAGPTVVLVHGALNDYRNWEFQTESLSTKSRVIAVSLRHYYPERWNGKGDDFTFQQHANDLAALIQEVGEGPVILVGHSRGGVVAFQTALEHPELVRRLVLMDPPLYSLLPVAAGAGAPDPRPARMKATAERFEKGDIDGGLEFYIDDVNGAGTWKLRTEDERQRIRDNAWTPVGEVNEPPLNFDCRSVAGLRIPVLLMTGEKSPRRYSDVQDVMQRCLPDVARVNIPDAAHPMQRMNPKAVNAALAKFLEN